MFYIAVCSLCWVSQKEARAHLHLLYFPFDLGDLEGSTGFLPQPFIEETSTLQKRSKANKKRRGFWLQMRPASWRVMLEILLPELLLDLTFPFQPDTGTLNLWDMQSQPCDHCSLESSFSLCFLEWAPGQESPGSFSHLAVYPVSKFPIFTLMSANFAKHTVSTVEIKAPDLKLHWICSDTLALGSTFPLLESWKAPCFTVGITPSYNRFHWTFNNNLGSSWSGVISPIFQMEKPRLRAVL